MMKKIGVNTIFLFLAVSLFTQCQRETSGAFSVQVKYKNADKMVSPDFIQNQGSARDSARPGKITRVLLEEIPYGGDMNPIVIDSATITSNEGMITLKGTGKEEAIFQLVFENGPFLLLINDEDNISVDVDLSKRDNFYTVNGSPASKKLKEFMREYSERRFHVNKAFAELDSLKQLEAPDSLVILSTGRKNREMKQLNDYLQVFIDQSDYPALSLIALGWSSRSLPQPEFENALNKVLKKFPDHDDLKRLKTKYELQKAELTQQKNTRDESSWVGKLAPELSLPTAEGNVISLATFRGKYLLVDFWASWCQPCRMENPNVVNVYNQYKGKNFDILGVSLDREKEPWLKAIKDDSLTWTHVSDLKYWDSKAVQVYHFEGIPYNVLVDPQGKVIAENLRGFELEKKLSEVLR